MMQVFASVLLNLIAVFFAADGFDEGAEEDIEDDFEHILAENIDGATQKRYFVWHVIVFHFNMIVFALICCPYARLKLTEHLS